ncbi:MAG TPA: anthranilate phosphoribosyltransferase [Bacteroidia bacterium]|nr:anthranilate phosphoribosyltransferase [Bacteroidia bacterium]
MKEILTNLFENKTLSREEARNILINIASGKYNTSQVAAFMSVYLMRNITVQELMGFQEAMLDLCLQMKFDSPDTIDIVGTGGDGKDTFNISTLACFITAGAGVKVTKHGNYGVSSVSGSSNVLEAIGYKFTNNKELLQKQLDTAGLCFMHAPLFHPAMKTVAPIRKELGVRTFFNILGPIVNPGFPKYKLIGVYNLEMARLYNYLLQDTSSEYTLLHSFDGYDEISLTADFKVISKRSEQVIQPSDLGFQLLKQQEINGGTSVEDAAKLFLKILKGEGTAAQNNVVCINAAMAIQCVHPDRNMLQCISEAQESLNSKKALNAFQQLIHNQ